MKTRTHPHRSRRPARASISHRESPLVAFGAWLSRIADVIAKAGGAGSHRRSHLRLVRRNGQPVPVPLRVVVQTRTYRVGRIVAIALLFSSLLVAGVCASIYLGLQTPAVSLSGIK